MTAHVSDFGLAKFPSEDPRQLSSGLTSTVGIRGTVRHAEPSNIRRIFHCL